MVMVQEEHSAERTPIGMLLDELPTNNILHAYERND